VFHPLPNTFINLCHILHYAHLQVNIVYKFGGSSVRDAERMREVADIICSFQENLPCVVLSAMGKVRQTEGASAAAAAAAATAATAGAAAAVG
jgi:aspartate kinase